MKTAAAERENFAFWVNTHDFDPSIALSLRSSWLAAELAYLCVAASSPHAADSRLTALPTLRPWTGETGRTTNGTHPRLIAHAPHANASRHASLDEHNMYLNAKLQAILTHMGGVASRGAHASPGFYMLIDDDTAVNVTRMKAWVRHNRRSPDHALYAGNVATSTSLLTVRYVGGGPGMLFSRAAVQSIDLPRCGSCVENVAKCRVMLGGKAHGNALVPACDIFVGICAALSGVNATHVAGFCDFPPWWGQCVARGGATPSAGFDATQFLSFHRAKPVDYLPRYFSGGGREK